MSKLIIYVALIAGILFSLSAAVNNPVQAQENTTTASGAESLDAVLAKAAAKSFLVALTRPELAAVRNFYLRDNVNVEPVLAEVGNVSTYQIIESDWLTPGEAYQVTAKLQPGNKDIAIRAGKYNGRWQIDNIQLLAATAATGSAAAVSATQQLRPVTENGSGKLVFQTKSGGDIYIINADGTGLRRVTHGIDPQLSPDGTQIAFTRWDPFYTLYTINVDGANETAWMGNKAKMKSATWSADGTRIVFSHLVFLDEGGKEKINPQKLAERAARSGEDFNFPEIPDNARGLKIENGIIEYVIPPDAHWWLGQVDLTKNEYQDLGTGSQYNYAPSWHPIDPNRLLFRGDKGIAEFNTQAQSGRPISFDDRDRGAVVYSPDGAKIALTYWQDGHWEIHTMNADGSNRQRLTETPLTVIAQNSRSDVFVNEEGYRTLNRAQPDQMPNPNWNNAAPVWSPDGSQIAFLTDRTGRWEIWIMNADGSNQRPMFSNGALNGIEFDYAGVDERMLSWR